MQEKFQDDDYRMPPYVPEVASILADGILRRIEQQMKEDENIVIPDKRKVRKGDR